MAETPPEDLLEWLTRIEERVGITKTTRATFDIEEAKELLRRELGYEPTESQLSSFMIAGEAKYEVLPSLKIEVHPVVAPWGIRYRYYDISKREWATIPKVMEAIRKVIPVLPPRKR